MSRTKRPKHDPRTRPSRDHVVRAVEDAYATDVHGDALEQLDRLVAIEFGGSTEYLQLTVVALSQHNVAQLQQLVDEALENPQIVFDRFLRTKPYSGWPEGWWNT